MDSKKILVFEPLSGGHRGNFIRLLTESVEKRGAVQYEYIFVISERYVNTDVNYIKYETINKETSERISKSGWFTLVLWQWRTLKRCCENHKPDHVFLLDLTKLEWPLVLFRLNISISTILFVQFPFIKNRAKRWFKYTKTLFLLKRNNIQNIFLLNGQKTVSKIKTHNLYKKTNFVWIPDPIERLDENPAVRIKADKSKTRFLFFGSISNRKGFDVLVKSMSKLPKEVTDKVEFWIYGSPQRNETYQRALQKLAKADNGLLYDVKTYFMPDREVCEAFQKADVLLMPYKRPEFSSGVLGLAAQYRLPVIGPRSGLLGSLIEEYKLGVTINVSVSSLIKAITYFTFNEIPFNPEGAESYLNFNSTENFSEVILNTIEKE